MHQYTVIIYAFQYSFESHWLNKLYAARYFTRCHNTAADERDHKIPALTKPKSLCGNGQLNWQQC